MYIFTIPLKKHIFLICWKNLQTIALQHSKYFFMHKYNNTSIKSYTIRRWYCKRFFKKFWHLNALHFYEHQKEDRRRYTKTRAVAASAGCLITISTTTQDEIFTVDGSDSFWYFPQFTRMHFGIKFMMRSSRATNTNRLGDFASLYTYNTMGHHTDRAETLIIKFNK